MNPWQTGVLEFHRAMQMEDGTGPFHRPRLRADLVLEEARELVSALGFEVVATPTQLSAGTQVGPIDPVATIDAICDLIYVACGLAVEMGVDLDPYYAEVQRTNMAKVGGPVRADGKRMKPPGWQPPDIAGLLAQHGWTGVTG